MTEVPSWFPGTETKPAPLPLLLVQGFVNTLDLEEGTDALADAKSARRWLVEARLLDRAARPTAAELERAREVRESLRWLLERNQGAGRDGEAQSGRDGEARSGRDGEARSGRDAEARLAPLRALAAAHRARLTVAGDGAIGLENARHESLDDGLFELLLIVHRAQEDGTWERLRICANPECRWAFFDRSRNQQGSWCEMATCGNRLKNRQLRARRR